MQLINSIIVFNAYNILFKKGNNMEIKDIVNTNLIRDVKDDKLIIFYNTLLLEKDRINQLILEDEYVGYQYKIIDVLIEIVESEMRFRKIKTNNKLLIKKIS